MRRDRFQTVATSVLVRYFHGSEPKCTNKLIGRPKETGLSWVIRPIALPFGMLFAFPKKKQLSWCCLPLSSAIQIPLVFWFVLFESRSERLETLPTVWKDGVKAEKEDAVGRSAKQSRAATRKFLFCRKKEAANILLVGSVTMMRRFIIVPVAVVFERSSFQLLRDL
jgi:hypothetical protein